MLYENYTEKWMLLSNTSHMNVYVCMYILGKKWSPDKHSLFLLLLWFVPHNERTAITWVMTVIARTDVKLMQY